MSATELELEDIQGNVLAGFNTNVEILIGLAADPERYSEIAAWLAAQASDLTTVADIREQRGAMKAQLHGGGSALTWLGVALGAGLLDAIRGDLFIHDDGFTIGYRGRARSLGDFTAPAAWQVGGPNNPLEVLLIVGSNDETAAEHRRDELIAAATAAGLSLTYNETARRIADLEHFGFRDGVSQPLVRGYDIAGTIGPGHFVFGYEREPGDGGFLPAIDANNYLRNGSLLVFRRLSQDVAMFRDFCARQAAALGSIFPGMTGPHLQALLVGRWPSGALASIHIGTDPGRPSDDNGFDFSADLGTDCPYGAHIRKVNPRAGPTNEVETPRILRRGIPYGLKYEDDPASERGLAFISYQTSIKGQSEFLAAGWMNSKIAPAPSSGHDLLVGRARGQRAMPLPGPAGPVEISDGGAQWINPTGGGYLFAPGKTALSRLTEPIADGYLWRARKLLARATSSVRETLLSGSIS